MSQGSTVFAGGVAVATVRTVQTVTTGSLRNPFAVLCHCVIVSFWSNVSVPTADEYYLPYR